MAIVKACPDCGQDLRLRTNRATGKLFLGCSAWPDCKHTEEIPETVRMREMGHPELPLFEEVDADGAVANPPATAVR